MDQDPQMILVLYHMNGRKCLALIRPLLSDRMYRYVNSIELQSNAYLSLILIIIFLGGQCYWTNIRPL